MANNPKHSSVNRRQFMATAAAMGATLAMASTSARASTRKWIERRDLYPEGVASGDPTSDSVILWTRKPSKSGKAEKLTVEVAEDADFKHVVATQAVHPLAENDWTVRVLVAGLKPASVYWYRFMDGAGLGSRLGRTKTAPLDTDDRPVNFAFASCQYQNTGANNAYRRMLYDDKQKPAADQLDFVMHLGDFVYELIWYPEDRPQGYYSRRIREVVRFPTGRKIGDYHIPIDLADYRALYRGYLADPDLADARAYLPFICTWDNHEFSWRGFQGLTDDEGKGEVVGAQTRKVAACQTWFEYQPARVRKAGGDDLNRFDAPKVEDVNVTEYDEDGLGNEPNNLAAIQGLKIFRQLRWGKNVDLLMTDDRSYRSPFVADDHAADPLGDDAFLGVVPQEAIEILDAGKAYNNGNPPAEITFGKKKMANFRKDKNPQTMLGKDQKAWFLSQLKNSKATWKIWGNSVPALDVRWDMKNLPKEEGKWPAKDYGLIYFQDWTGYRYERGEILDFVKTNGITGLTSVSGDRHGFFAGVLSKNLLPEKYEPVALEFVGASISTVGSCEVFEKIITDKVPLHQLYVRRPKDKEPEPMINFSVMHGVKAGFVYDKTGDMKQARAASNPEVSSHLEFLDMGGHGYSAVRATAGSLETVFVCIPRPLERSTTEDGGPVRYRVRLSAKAWKPGETPVMTHEFTEGDAPFSV